MKKVKKIFFTTIALTLTGLIMKTVAVFFNVYVTGKIGTHGMGLFQLVLSLYAFAKTLASAGISLAATRLCIENENAVKFTVRRMFIYSLLLGIISFSLLFSLSDILSSKWIGDISVSNPIKMLSFSLPFISLSTALNGYMTATRKLPRYSVIQLLEQISRIAVTVTVIKYVFTRSETALYGVTFGITASEVISFSLSLVSFLFDKRKIISNGKYSHFTRKMLRIAVPESLGAYIRSALNTIEHMLIPKGIRKSGANYEKSLSEYGALQGMALPIVLYPSSVFSVISGLLVPEIAECTVKNNKKEIEYIVNRVLSMSLIFSFAVSGFMLINADTLSFAVYKTNDAAYFIKVLSPLIPIMYLDMTTDGMLKGLDEQFSIMLINILDSFICVVLVFFLVPEMAISGYVITIYIAEIINFIFSFMKLVNRCKIRLKIFKNLVFPLFSSLISVKLSAMLFSIINIPVIELVLSATTGIIIYLLLLKITKSLSDEDFIWLKGLIKP